MAGTMIALRSSDREVLWFDDNEWASEFDGLTLFEVMEAWLVHGVTFTILEYHHKRKGIDVATKSGWWDKQLRNQGYDIYKERRQ